MNLLERLRRWISQGGDDPVLSSPPQDAQLELTSREQEEQLLDEGETRPD